MVPMTNENIMIRFPCLNYFETNSNLSNVDVSEKESGAQMMLSHLDPEWKPAILQSYGWIMMERWNTKNVSLFCAW